MCSELRNSTSSCTVRNSFYYRPQASDYDLESPNGNPKLSRTKNATLSTCTSLIRLRHQVPEVQGTQQCRCPIALAFRSCFLQPRQRHFGTSGLEHGTASRHKQSNHSGNQERSNVIQSAELYPEWLAYLCSG